MRLDGPVAHFLVNGTIVRTVACPVPQPARHRLRGARAGTAEPPRLPDPLSVQRRVSVGDAIMIGGQRIQVRLPHAGKTLEDHRAGRHLPDRVEDGITITAACKTSLDIKRHKASNYPLRASGR